jgi:hypothetical protein
VEKRFAIRGQKGDKKRVIPGRERDPKKAGERPG